MTGIILSISGDTVTLSQRETIACFGCMHQECKGRQRLVTAKNTLGLPLAVGQIAEAETPKSALISQALQVLLPPIVGFLGGFMLIGLLFPHTGEPPRAAGGVITLFAAACITYWVRKRFPAPVIPHITRFSDVP